MATTMFMPPPTMKYSPEPHTRQTTRVGKRVLVDHQLQPVVLFLPA